ncbi:hypothetical protein FIBSPDRAFT_742198 [Athelia psychrophila]|uniref:DUF6534 domain-containing protein n=1 Tax=Athelia psychrophila TaxID=1759441 RepID=A0A166J791_9AGAM|nr:hypothetical protein FIBSPDRAFT_742198 [Fibularhizoctonia sp. CBS 109695]
MGATLIGVILASALWGVTCVQVWMYYTNYPKDPWHLKALVAAVFISDTVHEILICHSIYTYLVTNFGNGAELGIIVWSILIEVLFSVSIILRSRSFLALRVWKFSGKNMYITAVVVLLVVGEFISVLYYTGRAYNLKTYAELAALQGPSMTINALGAAGDVVIAVSLCTMLHKSRTGFKRSDTMVKRLMLFTINTGLLTSICAIASLISIAASPNTFIYIAFFFMMGRLYSNTLMATLNARRAIRTAGTSEEAMSVSLPGVGVPPSRSMNLTVRVDTTRELTRDLRRDEVCMF